MTDSSRPGPTRRSMLAGATALGVSGLLGLAAPARAAANPALSIADCGTWGARQPSSPIRTIAGAPDKIIVHHTATPNVGDFSQGHAFEFARSMQEYQMDSEHWIDTGQNFTITRGGYVTEGRHGSLAGLDSGTRHVESAHCTGQNTVAIGIENEGTYTSLEPRTVHWAALVDLCTLICAKYGLRAYQIYGHRDFNNTECPGDRLYAMLPQLRREVAARIGGDPTGPVWPVLANGASGEQVRTLQYLLTQHGATLTVDGSYGPATESAVRGFQTTVRAGVDGIAGNQVWHQLAAPLAQGASGEAVKAVQSQLTAHGIATAVDGGFGPGTLAGVKSFQRAKSLPVDGVVDARTWARLLG